MDTWRARVVSQNSHQNSSQDASLANIAMQSQGTRRRPPWCCASRPEKAEYRAGSVRRRRLGLLLTATDEECAKVEQSDAFQGGGLVISGSADRSVKIWDAATGECLQTLQGHTDWVKSVCFLAGGEKIVSGSRDSLVKIWDAATGECLQTLRGHTSDVNSVCFSAGGEKIVSGSGDGSVKIWDAATGECLQTL
eukprot:SAG31_NODE_13172_length_887_cov_5.435279_1_plen_193_part_01